jgi:hypothetical protein
MGIKAKALSKFPLIAIAYTKIAVFKLGKRDM